VNCSEPVNLRPGVRCLQSVLPKVYTEEFHVYLVFSLNRIYSQLQTVGH